jgi:ubiquinone biosynthesis protein UbiJ
MNPTTEFFEGLASRHEPFLARISGTLRFDVADGDRVEHWYVTIRKGDVGVARKKARADSVVALDHSLADEIFSGRTNVIARMLRGQVHIEGDLAVMMQFQRLLPRPAGSPELLTAGYARRTS